MTVIHFGDGSGRTACKILSSFISVTMKKHEVTCIPCNGSYDFIVLKGKP